METVLHREAINSILRAHPGSKTKEFKKSLIRAIPKLNPDWWHIEDLGNIHEDIQIRPDVFLINEDERLVVCWEVEHTYPLEPLKYQTTFWVLDGLSIKLGLIRVHARTLHTEVVDIFDTLYQHIKSIQSNEPDTQRSRFISTD